MIKGAIHGCVEILDPKSAIEIHIDTNFDRYRKGGWLLPLQGWQAQENSHQTIFDVPQWRDVGK